MLTKTTYSSTISAVMHDVAWALNEAESRHADLYSVLAPVVIAAYADIDKSELGFVPGGEFGMCHGTIDATPPKNVAETVDMFMAMATKMGWAVGTHYNARGREAIDLEALDANVRLMPMKMRLQLAGYPKGSWSLQYASGTSNLTKYSSPTDADLLRLVETFEQMDGIAELPRETLDMIAQLVLAAGSH